MHILKSILKQAWLITWNNKYLWIFGFFAALMTAGGGEFNLLMTGTEKTSWQASFLVGLNGFKKLEMVVSQVTANLKSFFTSPYAIPLIILFIAVFLFFIWLAIISQVGLISSVGKISQKRKAFLKYGFNKGISLFWPALGVNVIGKLTIWGLSIILGLPLASLYLKGGNEALIVLLTLVLFIIFVPLAIVISFITRFALCFVVLTKKRVWPAFCSAFWLFKKEWLKSIGLALLLFLISIGIGIGLAILMIAAGLPFFILIFVSWHLAWMGLGLAILILAITILAAILFLGGAIFSTFQYNSWTLFFLEVSPSHPENWVRGLRRLPKEV